jgi:hypothetical protein
VDLVWPRGEPRRQTTAGQAFHAVPHLADVFRKRVPDTHLEDDGGVVVVRCHCGARTRLEAVPLPWCSGGCGRAFVQTLSRRVWAAGPFACDD